MKYINPTPKPSGAYYEPQSTYAEGLVSFPEEFLEAYYSAGGFIKMQATRGVASSVVPDPEAWEAWKAENPEPEPEQTPGSEPSGDYATYGELADAIREGVNSIE